MRYPLVLPVLVACLHADAPPAAPVPPPQVTLLDADTAGAALPPVVAMVESPGSAGARSNAKRCGGTIETPVEPEVWLRGSTHVHARPSGDSSTPIAQVIDWYERHAYDFIVLTDHNRVSEVDPAVDTLGQVTARPSCNGLIVLSGIELTYNPADCEPQTDVKNRCRIHVNLLGSTARPGGRLEWADRRAKPRVDKYQAAIAAQRVLGGLIQLNHPQWFWGTSPELLAELARRGVSLVEIANVQFDKWNHGDLEHPSTEQLWDSALATGVTLWGVASDDAHHYDGGGEYPAGGGWIVVRARRDPKAILDSMAAGRFYASTGVVLERAGVEGSELVVELAGDQPAAQIEFIENGKIVAAVRDRLAHRTVPATGYVRAVVTRDDGKKAWIQPARRPPL